MVRTCPVVDSRSLAKRTSKFALALTLAVSTLAFEGCSAVQNGSGASSQSSSSSSSSPQESRTTLPAATVGVSYQQTLSVPASSAGLVIAQAELPPGLWLNPQSRILSGVPSQTGTYNFALTSFSIETRKVQSYQYAVTVASSTTNNSVNVQVSPAETSVTLGGKVQFAATVKNTSNTAVIWTASAGTISANGLWTAPTGNHSTVTITATSVASPSAYSTATASVVANQAFTISTKTLPGGTTATSYSASLTTSGGQPPYLWSLASGTLPPGLQLNTSTGLISGSVTTAGTYSFSVQGKDGSSQTAQQSYTLVFSSSTACGPPAYPCSRTDQRIVQVPIPPNVGNLTGANTIVTDPDFGNRIVRITDANTDPLANFLNRTFVTATSGSADENLWNTDSTLFVVQDSGARAYPYTFDPGTMQAARMYTGSYADTGGFYFPDSGSWSHLNSNLLYVANGTVINKYDFTDRNNAPSPQLFYDFTSSPNCLPAGFTETWQTRGGISADDTVLGMGYSNKGGQGTGVWVVAYKVGSGCSALNTQTGQVRGDWGAQGTINIPDRWAVHNVKISKDGNWLVIAQNGCLSSSCLHGPYFWQIGTTTVYDCGQGGLCDGHWTEGYTHWVNNNNTPFTNQVMRLFDQPTSAGNITHSFPVGLTGIDQHQSWNNVDPYDSVPFLSATYTKTTPFPAPWYNEIIAVAADGSGTTWRFAHSFITANSQNFSTQYAIGSVSQDGKFFIFSSDWMGTLGSEQGSRTCTIGTNCRGDVFVVELR